MNPQTESQQNVTPMNASFGDGISSTDETVLQHEAMLLAMSDQLYRFYKYAEIPILTLGVIGHCLSLLTLFASKNMRSTSFLYHKALTMAELTYCANCFVQRAVDYGFSVRAYMLDQSVYSTAGAAIYASTISRMVSSTTGYIILYTTLLIAFDRFVAITFTANYRSLNRRQVAFACILASCCLALFVNSWSTIFDSVVTPVRDVDQTLKSATHANFSGNDSLAAEEVIDAAEPSLYFAASVRKGPKVFLTLRNVKDIYNSILRIAYPILLSGLTIAVVHGFRLQRLRRQRIVSLTKITTVKQARRRDSNLFYLLILIVVLAFVQVVPSEAKRIMELLYPLAKLKREMARANLISSERIHLMNLIVFGHIWAKPIANLCTFVDRSLSFYLYFTFNASFRSDTRHLWRKWCFARPNYRVISGNSSVVDNADTSMLSTNLTFQNSS